MAVIPVWEVARIGLGVVVLVCEGKVVGMEVDEPAGRGIVSY